MGHRDMARNIARVTQGKVKEVIGRTVGDERLEADGRTDQRSGHLMQAGEKVRDAFKE
jgi:uncharacterized protein YjbJ (UPF0337 family)